MLWVKADWFAEPIPAPNNPQLVLVRVQDGSLIPPRHAPVPAHPLVRAPYPWASARDDTAAWWLRPFKLRNARSIRSAAVVPSERGVSLRHDGGEFGFSVTAPPAERAAFACEITFPRETGHSLECVHTPERHDFWLVTRDLDAGIPWVFVENAVVHRIDQVPAQGVVLSPDKFQFENFTDLDIRFSASTRRVISVLETVIGALYDAAQRVHTVQNGRTSWGETAALTEDEICLQGLLAILNFPLRAAAATSAIRKVIKSRFELASALDFSVADAVRRNLDQRLIDSFKDVSSEDKRKPVGALNAYATGELDARGVLSIANQGVTGKVKTLTDEDRALPKLLREDLKGFRTSDIQAGHTKYETKTGAKGTPLGPLQWADKQTSGQYVALFVRELVLEWLSVISSLLPCCMSSSSRRYTRMSFVPIQLVDVPLRGAN